jgi:hypothetical protein
MMNQSCVPLGFTSVAVSGATAVKLPVPAGANMVLLVCETGACRFRDDGVAPSATSGVLIQPTAAIPFEYSGSLTAIQFFGVTGTVSIDCAFYGVRG